MNKFRSVAVDGPAGAGKSTLAKLLAERLGFLYVDTGAIYRTLGLYALRQGVDADNVMGVTALLDTVQIDLQHGEDGIQHMFLNGEDITGEIRRPEVSKNASLISAIPAVRDYLMEMQRDLARRQDVIMDGRDIGTVVLPHADVKIFLTAAPEVRARRRFEEMKLNGSQASYETVLRDVMQRDKNDTHRSTAPLRQAEDALLFDTTGNSLEESFDLLLATIKERLQV